MSTMTPAGGPVETCQVVVGKYLCLDELYRSVAVFGTSRPWDAFLRGGDVVFARTLKPEPLIRAIADFEDMPDVHGAQQVFEEMAAALSDFTDAFTKDLLGKNTSGWEAVSAAYAKVPHGSTAAEVRGDFEAAWTAFADLLGTVSVILQHMASLRDVIRPLERTSLAELEAQMYPWHQYADQCFRFLWQQLPADPVPPAGSPGGTVAAGVPGPAGSAVPGPGPAAAREEAISARMAVPARLLPAYKPARKKKPKGRPTPAAAKPFVKKLFSRKSAPLSASEAEALANAVVVNKYVMLLTTRSMRKFAFGPGGFVKEFLGYAQRTPLKDAYPEPSLATDTFRQALSAAEYAVDRFGRYETVFRKSANTAALEHAAEAAAEAYAALADAAEKLDRQVMPALSAAHAVNALKHQRGTLLDDPGTRGACERLAERSLEGAGKCARLVARVNRILADKDFTHSTKANSLDFQSVEGFTGYTTRRAAVASTCTEAVLEANDSLSRTYARLARKAQERAAQRT
ncbi:hypothetical protein LG634_07030 [Streptomyces bambusae]|uniref:hypothetical protein n=1 Tax=Streptomyces bambusae TaxID=1550616 RepID=UPI001CFEEAB7|nr:hypothetical protein [Streptomyces bambusae]MCB5164587.1 hypothetical protein [Streptomyces bambusae]